MSTERGAREANTKLPEVLCRVQDGESSTVTNRKGVTYIKRPDDGNMKGLAFIHDPDGYRVEILPSSGLRDLILGN